MTTAGINASRREASIAIYIGCIAIALAALLNAAVPLHAQTPRKGDPQRSPLGWDGRPATRSCHAEASDLRALKTTLIEHEKARIGFRNKVRHGVYSGQELSSGLMQSAAPAALVDMIAQRLADLESSGETAALVYDVGVSDRQYAICVWLISARGVEAAATVPIAEGSPFRRASPASMVRSGLDVEGRAGARAPQLRTARAAEPHTPQNERASPQLTEQAWSLLMPDAVAEKLQASGVTRLLILPVSDIGFVPFAALPLADRRLVDRFAIVLLPDVEALLGLSSAPRPWSSSGGMSGIVVGDPDLSQDSRWNFPPLAGARSEAVEVAAMVGERPLLGQEANKTRVLESLKAQRRARLIYLATHALSDAVNPMDGSFLALAGDHLYGRDIKGLSLLNGPLVVMSACQTGLGKVFEGGTFGLVRAWYHVGATQIVMSLWNIDDNATKDLMLEFMRRLKDGAMTEFALREAMLVTRQVYADPALWASLALYGVPSKADRPRESGAPRAAVPSESAKPSVSPMVPSGPAQQAVLYEEDPDDPAGRKSAGSVVWGTSVLPADRRDSNVHGEITIPGRKLSLALSLRRNRDPSLPASHIVEIIFANVSEGSGRRVENIPGILVKSKEMTRSKEVAGLSVKVAEGFFLIGLSAEQMEQNVALLRSGKWFDIPIVFDDGSRAILAIEKGSPGELAFDQAFTSWSASP